MPTRRRWERARGLVVGGRELVAEVESCGALRVLDALVRWYSAAPGDDAGLEVALDHAQRLLRPGSRLLVLADPASVAALPERWLAAGAGARAADGGVMQGGSLVLRDIHQPPAPPWWPPAPGWWLLAALLLLTLLALALRGWRRRRRRRAVARLFDAALAAPTPAARIAGMSELLRRAARQREPRSAALDGTEWLAFLDRGSRVPLFGDEDARLLLEGGYRRDADAAAVERLAARVRTRLLEWSSP